MIIDNKSNFLYKVFENKDIQELQILTSFITLYGFELIQKSLNTKTKLILSDSIEKILGTNEEIKYKNQLKQTYLAKKFEDFIKSAEIKSTFQNISLLNIIDKNSTVSVQVNFELSKYSINEADKSVLEKIKEIENKINSLKNELKKESNLNEKVEINMQIHKLKEGLNKLKDKNVIRWDKKR